jgi:hypothetical protein
MFVDANFVCSMRAFGRKGNAFSGQEFIATNLRLV